MCLQMYGLSSALIRGCRLLNLCRYETRWRKSSRDEVEKIPLLGVKIYFLHILSKRKDMKEMDFPGCPLTYTMQCHYLGSNSYKSHSEIPLYSPSIGRIIKQVIAQKNTQSYGLRFKMGSLGYGYGL